MGGAARALCPRERGHSRENPGHPASADTIPSSANVEDHVSMGTIGARQARQIAANVERILALELFSAAQAIDFRKESLGADAKMGQGTAPAYALIREQVPFLAVDDVMYPHIEAVRQLLASGALAGVVQQENY